jgi:glycosyltransferase involved in cell wall biosynthesis
MKKLSIVMPVYNEKKYFEKILQRVMKVNLPVEKEIVIVESNSTDGTRQLVKKYEKKKGFKIIYEDKPRGKGSAVKRGFKAATGDIILVQDADLEYNPQDYPKLIEPILKNKTKFVLGSRKMGQKTWKIRNSKTSVVKVAFINIIANLADTFFNILYGVHLTDSQTMYKVFRRECIKGIDFKSNHFNLDFEICARLIRRGYIPLEVPIRYKSRSFSEGKKIKLSRDIFINLYTIIKYRIVKS